MATSRTLIETDACPGALLRGDTQWSMGQMEVLDLLGDSSKSSTIKCRCKLIGQIVAVKMYDKQVLTVQDCHQVAREVEIHAQLNHPHILGMYAAFEDLDGIYLVLEYAPGGNLYSHLSEAGGHLPEAEVSANIIRPLISALAAIHSQGIIHRDVKPENLLRDANGVIRLADFGLAVDCTQGLPTARVGTLDYFAPEVVDPDASSGSQGYGPGVDVWAVGILAYELLLGGPPFEAETKQETLRRILTDQPFLPRHWSRSCRDFLTEENASELPAADIQVLSKDPKRRPTAEKLLQHPWLVPPVKQETCPPATPQR